MKTLKLLLCILVFWVFTLSASNWNINHINDVFISDEISEICVFDSVAYFSTTYGLVKMDVADRENLQILKRFPKKFEICELTKRDTLLFVGYKTNDILEIYNLSNSSILDRITQYNTDGRIGGTYFCDSNLFLKNNQYLHLYSINDIRNPVHLDSIRGGGYSIDFFEHFACIASNDYLKTFSFEDPTNLSDMESVWIREEYDINQAFDILIEDDLAYVASTPFSIFSLGENPLEPELIGRGESNGRNIAKSGDYAFLGGDDIYIYDVSNPRSPDQIASLEIEGERVLHWTRVDEVLFSAHEENGLRIFDITNPQRPELTTHYENSGEYGEIIPYQNYLYQIVTHGNYARFVKIISIENPVHPTLVDSVTWDFFGRNDHVSKIHINENLLAVNLQNTFFDSSINRNYQFEGIELYSLENPEQPLKLSSIEFTGVNDIVINEDHLYVGGDEEPGLNIYSLENLEEPRLVERRNEHGRCDRIVIQDDLLITHNRRRNVYTIVIWDKTDPENLEQLGISYNWVRPDFAVLGNWIYIEENDFIYFLSFEDPTQIEMEHWIQRDCFVRARGGKLILTTQDSFEIYNVPDPIEWELVGRFNYHENRVRISEFTFAGYIGYGKHKSCISIYDFTDVFNLWYLTPSVESYDFGDVELDSISEFTLTIINRSQDFRELSDVELVGDCFEIELEELPWEFEPEEEFEVTVFFNPAVDTLYSGSIILHSEDMTREIQLSGTGIEFTSVDDEIEMLEFTLGNAYPNPFNAMTVIPYSSPTISHLRIDIYDITGRLIEILVNNNVQAGFHNVCWDASNVTTGVYLVKMDSPSFSSVRKVIFIR